MAEFKDRLELALQLRDIKPAELAKRTGIGEGAISQYRKGAYKATQRNLEKISKELSVSIPWLMGITDDMDSSLPSNIRRLEPMQKIPLVGRIACGEPILAVENIEDYIDLPRQIHADFALTCKGDSMVNAGIQDGDVVYIKEQPTVENGQIAAVMVGDEATLKRFYHTEDSVRLVAENPTFPTLSFFGEEITQIRVIGLAVAYTHALIR